MVLHAFSVKLYFSVCKTDRLASEFFFIEKERRLGSSSSFLEEMSSFIVKETKDISSHFLPFTCIHNWSSHNWPIIPIYIEVFTTHIMRPNSGAIHFIFTKCG